MGRVTVNARERSAFLSPPYLLVLVALIPALVMVWGPGYPRGADTWGHLFKAEYLANRLRADGPLAYVRSAWMPAWYMGDPYLTYYPPLTSLTLAPLIYLLRDPFVAYRVFVTLFTVLLAHLTYGVFAGRWNRERWQAAFTAVLVLWAPYTLRTLFFEGNLPRVLAVLALPVITYFTESLLARPGPRGLRLLAASLAWSWAIVAHAQQAYMFAVGFALYAVIRVILDPAVPVVRLIWVVLPIALGAAVAAPWALPAYSRGELSNIPYLPPIKVDIFSAPLRALAPAVGVPASAVTFGTGALLLALLSVIARPNPRYTAWLLAGAACLWLSLGPAGVAFSLVPGSSQLLPERFANFSAFAIPIAAGGLVPLGIRARRIRMIVIAGLLFIDIFPAFPLLRGGDYPQDRAAIANRLAEQPSGGRVALMVYPEPNALDVYFASTVGGHDQINGWALENTPHHVALRRVLSAPDWGPGYLARLFEVWDVRSAIVSGTDQSAQAARHALTAAGFAQTSAEGDFELWALDRPASPLLSLPSDQMLVVGDQTEPFLAAFPFAEDGSRTHLVDYASAELNQHPVLGLMRFNDNPAKLAQAEALLRDWVSAGRTAIVDLSGMEEPFSQGLDFMGVSVLRLAFSDALQIHWSGPLAGQPEWLPLQGLPEPGWSGAVYRNLDGVLAEVEHNGVKYPVVGYKNVGAGRIWFVGLNLLYYSQASHTPSLAAAITHLTLEQTPVARDLTYSPVPTESASFGDGQLDLAYTADEAVDALLSFTYSPRWRAEVDGQPVVLSEYQHLMRAPLPAGRHELKVIYQPFGTVWPRLGLLVGLLSLGGLLAFARVERMIWRRRLQKEAASLQAAEDQRASDRQASVTYTSCLNCGFKFSEAMPPTPATYPFNLIACPICGQRLDGTGFRAGNAMTAADRQAALAKWLTHKGYDIATIDPRRDFSVETFFEGDLSPLPLAGEPASLSN